ncbi:DUF4190 domain-containing protein [Streptomyces sp. NPDC048416]|uniref:DUF4190 domain-containing protein n=1 Tax=Streptomyces sp. NPDC048416 TaxID=3365546 RepID=UPI00371EB9B4
MSENTQQPPGGQEPRDPWAPPEHKVPLDKPSVHDQQTVVSMPAPPTGAPNGAPGAPGSAPPPGAPGQQAPGNYGYPSGAPTPPSGQPGPGGYGYPAGAQIPPPGQPDPGGYGYPAYPQQPAQTGGYPGYPGQQPSYGYPGWAGMSAPQNGFGTAAMVLGIIACASMFCTWGIAGIVLGVLALIFGLLGKGRAARGEANNRGQAVAGVVMGIIGIVLGIAILVLVIVAFADKSSRHDDYDYWNAMSATVLTR